MSEVLVIPNVRAVVRRSCHSLIEAKLIPLVLFLVFLEVVGNTAAIVAALAWSVACVTFRLSTGRRVPGLVILSTAGLAVRTVGAMATGSMIVYFIQPTASTAVVGAAFLVSVGAGRPLAQRLAQDFCPFDPTSAQHPRLRQFFVRLSLVWAAASMINAAITLWLLLTQSVATFVLVKAFLGPGLTALTIVVAVGWFRFTTRSCGLRLVFEPAPQRAVPRSALAVE